MQLKTKTTLWLGALVILTIAVALLSVVSATATTGDASLALPRPTKTPAGPKPTRTPPVSGTPTATPPPGGSSAFQVVNSPNVETLNNRLNAVSAVAPNDVWAVGELSTSNGSNRQTLIQHWNGSSWQIISSPNPDANSNTLLSVAAVTANDVWAVGRYGGNSGPNWQPLILRYDGAAWNVVPAPSTGTGAAQLTAVTARGANDVWAVGSFTGPSTNWWEQPLVMHWDGTAWNIIPSPQLGTSSVLNGVTAVAADDVWAVGYTLSGGYSALIMHWDGTAWTPVASNANGSARLFDVAAVSANDIWAVGSQNNFSATLTLHWDGSNWSPVASPNGNYVGTNQHALVGLAVTSTNEVWAVGSSAFSGLCGGSDASHYWTQTLALLWNGASWQQVGTENPGSAGGCNTPRNDFYGVTTINGQTLAVGAFYEPSLSVQRFRTLIEQSQ